MSSDKKDVALLTAVRALDGLDDGALDAVTPAAMRRVMERKGWSHQGTVRFVRGGDAAQETYAHPTARGCRKGATLRTPVVPVARGAEWRARVVEWASTTAERHGDVSAAEVLAEALANGPPRRDVGAWLEDALHEVFRAAQAHERLAIGAADDPAKTACASGRAEGLREAAAIILRAREEATPSGPADPFLAAVRSEDGAPWPLTEALERLVKAADHLLDDHNCDEEGNEEVRHAVESGRRIVAALRAAVEGGGARG